MIIKIGKAKDNDFIANDPHVSRHHARLIREDVYKRQAPPQPPTVSNPNHRRVGECILCVR